MEKERVTLVVPPYSDSASIFERVEKVEFDKKKSAEIRIYPPLGLLYLAGTLNTLENVGAEIIDSAASRLNFDDIISLIQKEPLPKVIGIGILSVNLYSAALLIQKIRKKMNKPPLIVVGGPHISKVPKNTFELGADFGFMGDSDLSFKDFVKRLLSGEPVENIPGLISQKNGEIIVNPPQMIENLSSIPHPPREILLQNAYIYPAFPGKFTSVATTRGCPFNCIYCGVPHKRKYRERNIDDVIKELKKLSNFKYINFVDDCFTVNRKRIIQLCERMITEKFDFRWGCATRIECVDSELMKLMRRAGCYDIRFGIESGNEDIRNRIKGKKEVPNEFYIHMIVQAKKAGLKTVGFFLLGLPDETLQNMRETVEFSKKLELDFAYFGTVIPVPGSRLFEIAKEEGKTHDSVWSEMIKGKAEIPQYVPDGYKLEQIKDFCKKADMEFYLRPSYIFKRFFYLTNFREFKHHALIGWRLFRHRLRL